MLGAYLCFAMVALLPRVGGNFWIGLLLGPILVAFLMIELFPDRGEFYTVLMMSPLILFWGEILPKSLFRQRADLLAPRVIYVLYAASRLFFPILWLITAIPRALAREGRTSQKRVSASWSGKT
jgi:CBS domain containing-hemolysin-like protein